MKIRLVGAEFHTDGRTDGQTDMKRIVALRNFCEGAKKNSNFTHFVKPNIRASIVGLFLLVVVVVVDLLIEL